MKSSKIIILYICLNTLAPLHSSAVSKISSKSSRLPTIHENIPSIDASHRYHMALMSLQIDLDSTNRLLIKAFSEKNQAEKSLQSITTSLAIGIADPKVLPQAREKIKDASPTTLEKKSLVMISLIMKALEKTDLKSKEDSITIAQLKELLRHEKRTYYCCTTKPLTDKEIDEKLASLPRINKIHTIYDLFQAEDILTSFPESPDSTTGGSKEEPTSKDLEIFEPRSMIMPGIITRGCIETDSITAPTPKQSTLLRRFDSKEEPYENDNGAGMYPKISGGHEHVGKIRRSSSILTNPSATIQNESKPIHLQ